MGGRPCIRGLRVTVGTIVGLIASGSCRQRILQAYPQLEAADIEEALADSWVSRQVSIGDLFAHRSGLPGEFGNDLEPLGWDRQQIFERARLEPAR